MKNINLSIIIIGLLALSGCSKFIAEQEIKSKGFHISQDSLNNAISQNRIDVVKLFIESKFELNPPTDQTPISRAAAVNNLEITRLLLESGALPQRNTLGESLYAIDAAIANCNDEIFILLLQYGADLNIGNRDRLKFIDTWVESGKYKCLKIQRLIKDYKK